MYAKTAYATRWVGLGLWGRCISYVRENCVSYAHQQISHHMHVKTAYYMHAKHVCIIYMPKSVCSYQYHEFSFLFGVLFVCIFTRPGSKTRSMLKTNEGRNKEGLVTCFHVLSMK